MPRCRARLAPLLTIAALAVSVPAGGAGGAGAVGSATAPPTIEPVLATRADELRRLAAPVVLPVDRAPRLLFVGDSVGATLAPAVGAEARGRGALLSANTRPGCGLLPGLPTTYDGWIPPWTRACEQAVPSWRRAIAATPADVVIVLSTWDGSPRTLDGVFVDPATAVGHATTVDLVRGLVDDVAPVGSGRSVALLAESIPTRGAVSGEASPGRIAEARHHRAILRTVARADPARVRVIDLGQWLCPLGPPCPDIIEGLQARGDDGGHFTADGAAWLAPRLLDALGVPPA